MVSGVGSQMTNSLSDHDTAHGACGKTWRQRGNRTGHCSGCHETFEGETVFDAHRVTDENGDRVCLAPSEVKIVGVALRVENGTWRGPRMSKEQAERAWGR